MTLYQRLAVMHRLLRYRYRAERAELRFVLGRQYQDGSLLDIGAHRGVYSYWMHRQFRNGTRVVAFEPQAELADYLSDFKQAFRLDRLSIVPVALSSRSGALPLHRHREHWSRATVDEYCEDGSRIDIFDVPVTTLDEYLAQHAELRPVRFIKCDVEDHEADVLAGAERVLSEDRPELLVEWSTPRRAYRERLFQQMQRLGYSIYQFESGRLKLCKCPERRRPPSWELGPKYVMLPREVAAAVAA
jgi:FkbM family methyltransferase